MSPKPTVQKLRRPLQVSTLTAFAAVLLAGCPGSLDNPEDFANGSGGGSGGFVCPTDIQADFITPRCISAGAGCHTTADAGGGLDLESPGVASRLVGVPSTACGADLVDTANLENSVMYTKCLDSNSCGLGMPLAGAALEPAELDCLLDYLGGL